MTRTALIGRFLSYGESSDHAVTVGETPVMTRCGVNLRLMDGNAVTECCAAVRNGLPSVSQRFMARRRSRTEQVEGQDDVFGRSNDLVYVDVAPGVIPPAGQGHVERLKGRTEWHGDPAVRFEPPRGVSPVLAGTVIDGSVDPHDIGAMMIDLSLRGWFRIEKEGEDAWVFIKPEKNPDGNLTVAEAMFMNALFPAGTQRATLPELKARLRGSIKQIMDSLYRSVTDQGWYERDPRSKGALGVGGRAPRTADGTAIRIQTLGFRKYLETAEAKQIKFEEAAGLFSRYLPYAMAFGLAKRWASVIGDVAKQAQLEGFGDILGGVAGDPFFWMLYGNGIAELSIDAISGLTDLLSETGGLFDLGDVAGGLGDAFDSIGDAIGDIGDFFS